MDTGEPTSISTASSDSVTSGNAVAAHVQHHVSVPSHVTQLPPEQSIEKSAVDPKSVDVEQRLFALVIGINEYKHAGSGLRNLQGAVADADDMSAYLSTLAVDPSHIHNLRDDQATHDGIINAFKALTVDARIHPNDAIVIFFAGHGSTKTATGLDGVTRDVEMIIPHDFLARTTQNPQQQGIFDTTLAHLFNDLAKAKGNNITAIFDSCHAGSVTRNEDIIPSRGIDLPKEYVVLPSALLPVISSAEKEEEKGGSRSGEVATGYEFYGLASHVLLAACSRKESAYESNMRGCFTQELLSKLRTITVPNTTYRSLMGQLRDLSGQHPQCEGRNIDRVLFDGKVPIGNYVVYSVKVTQDKAMTLNGGDVHGIAADAEFDIYDIYPTRDSGAQRLCRLVATVIRADSCDLAPLAGSKPDIPQPAWAVQATPGLRPKLGVLVREAKFDHVKNKLSGNRLIQFVNSDTATQHEFELKAVGTDAVFVVPDEHCGKEGLTLEKNYPIESTDKICSVLEDAADFFFHLRRSNPSAHLADNVIIKAYDLRKAEADRVNLVDGDKIRFVFAEKQTMRCGFELINTGSRDLYVWVFLFNVIDLSIESIYTPGVANSGLDHSLPAGVNPVTVGYGAGGTAPCEFSLEGAGPDLSYLKIYITTEPVTGNLSHIQRRSAFERADMRKGKKLSDGPVRLPQWDTKLVPIVQTAAK